MKNVLGNVTRLMIQLDNKHRQSLSLRLVVARHLAEFSFGRIHTATPSK